MSLFPNEDILTKEIESWRSFGASLNSEEYKKVFDIMLSDCYKYANAVNAKGEPFTTDSLLMSLLLSQQKMIDWLSAQLHNKQHYHEVKVES
jgi:predicted secreted hydrolase